MGQGQGTAPARPGVVVHEGVDEAFVRDYRRDGYAALGDALGAAEIEAVNAEAVRLCRELSAGADGDGATDDAADDAADEDVLRSLHCIHYPHKASRLLHATLAHPALVEALTSVVGPNVKAVQSMFFTKAEGKPGQAWHQDEHFIPTRDRSLTAAWVALDDATTENGCLWVLPGSHRRGVLYPDREVDDDRFDCNTEAYGYPHAEEDAVPVELPAGAALFFNGYLLHRSLPNTGRHGFRRALVNHYMSAESLLPWREAEGEHFGEYDFRDVVLVAGSDPYAFKGLRDVSRPHVRADRSGGCDR